MNDTPARTRAHAHTNSHNSWVFLLHIILSLSFSLLISHTTTPLKRSTRTRITYIFYTVTVLLWIIHVIFIPGAKSTIMTTIWVARYLNTAHLMLSSCSRPSHLSKCVACPGHWRKQTDAPSNTKPLYNSPFPSKETDSSLLITKGLHECLDWKPDANPV